ncbi:MAG: PorP/SprF family type IX secretion system membrane protein [Saprospiraceae bacterium]|nr:PorP/SprF family type IX secretion system membrane protein [Saprospiraceae bacterium]
MKTRLLLQKFYILLITGLVSLPALHAQDIHFAQFHNSPVNLSPGLVGVFGGDIRFVANYRQQWKSVPVPYSTFMGSFENKFFYSKGKFDRYITGGILITSDEQGSAHLKSLQIGIPLSLTIPLSKNHKHFLTAGFNLSYGQRKFSTNSLSFDNQFIDFMYNPNADPIEGALFANTSIQYFDVSHGLNWRYQSKKRRTKFDLGGATYHLNRPNHDFWSPDRDVRLDIRKLTYFLYQVQITKNFDLVGQYLWQNQGTYNEQMYTVSGRIYLNQKPYHELALQIGFNYRSRHEDAIVPVFEVHWKTWMLGLSYDLNAWSDVGTITDRKGGPELSLMYRLYKIKPMPKFKSCPII